VIYFICKSATNFHFDLISLEGLRNVTHLEAGYPNRWSDACEYDVTRDLADDISYCPACLHIVELISIKIELFFPEVY
jgi:hypothetical protein